MKKKLFAHSMSVLAITGFVFLGLGSATSGPITVKTYKMETMPAAGTLQGKNVLLLDLAMAQRKLPTKVQSSGSGLFGIAENAVVLHTYKKYATNEQAVQSDA
jgi:hypothetical protein